MSDVKTPPVLALDRLLIELAKASASDRRLIAGCQMCRNRVLYLLATAPVHEPQFNQQVFRARIASAQITHDAFHGTPGDNDSAVPRIPWIRGESEIPETGGESVNPQPRGCSTHQTEQP